MAIRKSIKIKLTIIFVGQILFLSLLQAQSKNSYIFKNSFVLNLMEDIGVERDNISYTTVYDTSRIIYINFVNPALIVNVSPTDQHELELSKLVFSNKEITIHFRYDSIMQTGLIQHFDEKLIQLTMSYFYSHRFSNTQKPLEFYLGTGLSYSISSSTKTPVDEQIYPWFKRRNNKQQLDIIFRPKAIFHISNKFVADINVGISVFQYYTHSYTNEGSIYTQQPDKTKLKKNDIFAQLFRIGIGIGYKL